MTDRITAILIAAVLTSLVVAACDETPDSDTAAHECWDEWYAKKLAEVPKPDGTHNPLTGKQLSQTPGAIRTRERKLQAFKDAMTLRGKNDPAWRAYRNQCIIAKAKSP